jgi:hypothetical protein
LRPDIIKSGAQASDAISYTGEKGTVFKMRIIEGNEELETSVGRPSKYPWDKWLVDGKRIRIYHGEDFELEVTSMRPQIHQMVKRRGGSVRTRIGREKGIACIDIVYTAGPRPARRTDFDFDNLADRKAPQSLPHSEDPDVERVLRGESMQP